jgi:broad specificity phosphatase PhoE
MKKLIIIRAGNPAWEEENRIQGTLPLPLCHESRQAMDDIARTLDGERFDCVYSSGNESSGVTAGYLARQCGKKTRRIASLHEPNFGLWQGLRLEDIRIRFGNAYKQWRADPTCVCPPQGETILDAYGRVLSAMKRLKKKNDDKTLVVVVARTVAAMIECVMTNKGLDNLWDIAERSPMMRVFDQQTGNVEPAQIPKQTKKPVPVIRMAPADAAIASSNPSPTPQIKVCPV